VARQGYRVGARPSSTPCVLHRLVTTCGQCPAHGTASGESPRSKPRTAHRWKAPRVQRISIFFAEARVKRPSVPGWRCPRKRRIVRLCRWSPCGLRKRIVAVCSVGAAGLARAGRAGGHASPRFLAGREKAGHARRDRRGRSAPARLDGRSCSFGVSTRSCRGFVTRGVRADRVGAKLPSSGAAFGRSQGVMKTDATHDERRRAARAGRPLARETSADIGRKPFQSRKAQRRAEAPASPGFGSRCGGWGPNLIWRFFLPVQRELGATRRRA